MQPFYRYNFDEDELRLKEVFRNADKLGLHLEERFRFVCCSIFFLTLYRSVSIDEVKDHLLKRQPLIMLVDSRYFEVGHQMKVVEN